MDSEKNDTVKHFKLILLFLLVSLAARAEHLFEAGIRGGMASYDAQCHYVSSVPGIHGGIQISYAYHSPHIAGLRIAATLDRHQAGYSKINYEDSYSVIDVENEPMQVDYSIGHLHENYATWSVGIPVQLALTKKQFYFYIGPKFVFPLLCQWREKAENAALSVYYPLQDNRVYNSFPLAASPLFQESQSGSVQVQPRVQYWVAAEAGYDIRVHTGERSKSYLSIGIYLDYSFSRISADPSDRISLLMLSDTRDGFPLHRILTPVVSAQRQGKRLVSPRNPFDFGIKISYRIAPYNPRRNTFQGCRCYGIWY